MRCGRLRWVGNSTLSWWADGAPAGVLSVAGSCRRDLSPRRPVPGADGRSLAVARKTCRSAPALACHRHLDRRCGGEGVGHVTGPQGGLEQRLDLLGGKLRADAELKPGKTRPVVGARGGDGEPGYGDAPLARGPLQR